MQNILLKFLPWYVSKTDRECSVPGVRDTQAAGRTMQVVDKIAVVGMKIAFIIIHLLSTNQED